VIGIKTLQQVARRAAQHRDMSRRRAIVAAIYVLVNQTSGRQLTVLLPEHARHGGELLRSEAYRRVRVV